MKYENLNNDKDFVHNANAVVDAGQQFVRISALQYGDNCQRMIMAVACMAGPHMALAAILSPRDKSPVTEDHGLLAALVTRRCIEHTADNKSFALSYNIQNVLDAMHDYEKLTGKRPDAIMAEHLAAAAREVEKEGASAFDAFMAGRQDGRPH